MPIATPKNTNVYIPMKKSDGETIRQSSGSDTIRKYLGNTLDENIERIVELEREITTFKVPQSKDDLIRQEYLRDELAVLKAVQRQQAEQTFFQALELIGDALTGTVIDASIVKRNVDSANADFIFTSLNPQVIGGKTPKPVAITTAPRPQTSNLNVRAKPRDITNDSEIGDFIPHTPIINKPKQLQGIENNQKLLPPAKPKAPKGSNEPTINKTKQQQIDKLKQIFKC